MSMTKLQIPIDEKVRDGLAKRAEQLGFDSIQAYIRFWAKAEVEGRQVDFGEADDWGEPSPEAAARLNRWADEALAADAKGELKGFDSAADLVADIMKS